MIKLDPKALKGSFPPLVTPFKADGSVDYDTYASLVDFQAKGGSHGIVVAGTTGEPSTLTLDPLVKAIFLPLRSARVAIEPPFCTRMAELAPGAGKKPT